MQNKKVKTVLISAQVATWVLVVFFPALILYFITYDLKVALEMVPQMLKKTLPLIVYFYLNYLVLIPKSLFSGHGRWFYYVNGGCFVGLLAYSLIIGLRADLPEGFPINRGVLITLWFVILLVYSLIMLLLAIGLRYFERYYQLKEQEALQKQKAAEAEISWLKSQLNPHFLFNTLNNISSLTQIDADKAQDSIGQLSELLRYALYESNEQEVDLNGEVEFMENYINLMSLRCNDLADISYEFDTKGRSVKVAPLLFISPVENAFKHGINAREKSFVRVWMQVDDKDLVFTCDNSLFENKGTDRIGSGIGLNNLQKRLELIYPGRYKYISAPDGDIYRTTIILKGIC